MVKHKYTLHIPSPEEQLRYLSQSVMLEETSNPHIIRILMAIISLAVLLFVIWSSIATVKEIATAPGEVMPSGHIQTIQHLEGGILKAIQVREGQKVAQEDVVLLLEGGGVEEDLQRLQRKQLALELQAERLKAFVDKRKPDFSTILTDYKDIENIEKLAASQQHIYQGMLEARKSARAVLRNQIEQKHKTLEVLKGKLVTASDNETLAQEAMQMTEGLLEKGLISKYKLISRKEGYNNAVGEKNSLLSEITKSEETIMEFNNRLISLDAQHRDDAYQQLEEVETERVQNAEMITKLKKQVERLAIRAPVNGIVKGLQVNTLGAVIPAGHKLMEIVPSDDNLVVEIRISPNDIGHIHIGQPVRVKVSSYDFARYGVIEGRVDFLSATTFMDKQGNPYYQGRIVLDRNHVGTGEHKIIAGMTVNADIITGEKTILSYLLKPIHLARMMAFSER